MALKIRLRQHGRSNHSVYRLVLTDCRSPRDGKYLEMLGWYNPLESEQDRMISVNAPRIQHWLNLGAQLSENAASLLRKTAPSIIRVETQKEVQRRAKAAAKRKAKKSATA